MIVITLGQIIDSIAVDASGTSAFARLFSQPLPAVEAFKLRRLGKLINSRAETFNDVRMELVKRYGTPTASEDNNFSFTPETSEAFNKEMQALTNNPEKFDCEPFSISALGEVRISAADLDLLDWLIVD